MPNTIRIGTRGSALALWQADFVQSRLEQCHPEYRFERKIIKTEGDRDQKSSLTKIGGQGVFTKAIEDALLAGDIDIAVHSLKDLPSAMTPGLELTAVPERGPVADVLITRNGQNLQQLAEHAVIATGSIRRRCQLLRLRPDISLTDLRGNIDTRLKKLKDGRYDAIIMAHAALHRLQLNDVPYHVFSPDEMIPAVGQGAVGVQLREQNDALRHLVRAINDAPTEAAVVAERAFLKRLDSGCQFPVGAHAELKDDHLHLRGFVSNDDGGRWLYAETEGPKEEAALLGERLGEDLIQKGARDILKQFQ